MAKFQLHNLKSQAINLVWKGQRWLGPSPLTGELSLRARLKLEVSLAKLIRAVYMSG